MNDRMPAVGAGVREFRPDLAALLAALVAATGLLVFLLIADRVTAGPPGHVDEWLLRAMRDPAAPNDPIGPRWAEDAARDLTALGGFTILTLLVAAATGYLFIARRRAMAALVAFSAAAALLLSHLLKEFFGRPRPEVVPHLVRVSTESFPSGHAMLSTVVYLTLGALLARVVRDRAAKFYVVATAVALTALIGMSRVYLGVHYPTDVVAGWAAGLTWATCWWVIARAFRKRFRMQEEHESR
jgi:undecaprenyl-diphosphatase